MLGGVWLALLVPAAAYALGSVSFALLFARRAGVDLRGEGSGNPGATNAGRLLGKKVGRLVLVLDLAKGALPTLVALGLFGLDHPITAVTGVAAVAGHCFPIWHGLRGGKGAATAAGVLLTLVPFAGLAAAATYVGLKRMSHRASVGSLGGALVGAAIALVWLGPMAPRAQMAMGVFLLVTLRHADNVKRLLRGEEPPS